MQPYTATYGMSWALLIRFSDNQVILCEKTMVMKTVDFLLEKNTFGIWLKNTFGIWLERRCSQKAHANFLSQLAHFGFHGLYNNIFYLMNFAEYEMNIFINGY